MRFLLTAVWILLSYLTVYGQGTVRGKVTDNLGEPLIGVTLVVKGNAAIGAATDFDGNYSVKVPDATPVVLVVSYVGYKPVEETVNPKNNEVVVRNITLLPSAMEVKEVEVSAKAVKAADYYMEDMKKKSATTIDYVSSETMRKTGDNNVTSAISRVTGVSNNSAGFITVRGIGDRYLRTSINGSIIPTLDPFTNNIRLDFIPANLVDNIIISKTASPDLPASWAGAYISVETKDYPEQLTVAAETQIGYNTQSTFQNVLGGERSSTDWLGFDDGLRDRDNNQTFYDFIARPTQYQSLSALGLRDFYANLGVTGDWEPNSPIGNDLYNLGLVELGLLPAALVNDPAAVSQATAAFESGPALDAYSILNNNAVQQNKLFPNTWLISSRKAPINFSQSFGVGNQYPLGKKNSALGYLFGIRYANSVQHDGDGSLNRARIEPNDSLAPNTFFADQVFTRESNSVSALLKLSYKINSNNSISAVFMPNLNGSNNLRTIIGTGIFEDQPDAVYTSQDQFFEERRQLVYQLSTDHYLPALKAKIKLDASYTDGNSNIPDFRSLSTFLLNEQLLSGVGNFPNTRDYRYLNENLFDSRISFELPINEKPGKSRKIKLGGSYNRLDRDFNQYQYVLSATDSSGNILTGSYDINGNDLTSFLNPENFDIESYTFQGLPKRRSKLLYVNNDFPGNRTVGYSEIIGYFAMFDYSFSFKWRASGGLRVEHADIFGDIYLYDKLGYAKDDIRRRAQGEAFVANPGIINTTKLLPSLSLIYKYRDDDSKSMNLRANYSRTTAYPSIREITENNVLDFELRVLVFGNSNLVPADVDNFDLRWEGYYKKGNSFSVSAFYKKFKNHIELLNFNDAASWTNVDDSYVAGIELEGVKKITSKLELRGNVALIQSETNIVLRKREVINDVTTFTPVDTLTRRMFGQAPYVVNAILSYSFEKARTNLAISYNIQGPRLVIAATENLPDIFELPRNVIDAKVTKQIGDHFTASLTVRDILNQPIRRAYDLKVDQELDFDRLRWGTSINLGITYRL